MALYPSPVPSGLGRRTLILSAAGAALLTGCTQDDSTPDESGESVAAGNRARARAARESTDLMARYDAVIAAHPGLSQRLAPLRAETAQHARAFGATASAPSASPDGAAAPSAPPSTAVHVPADEQSARTMLADAERSLADRRMAELLKVPGELARLLASVGAAGATHVYLLTEDGK